MDFSVDREIKLINFTVSGWVHEFKYSLSFHATSKIFYGESESEDRETILQQGSARRAAVKLLKVK